MDYEYAEGLANNLYTLLTKYTVCAHCMPRGAPSPRWVGLGLLGALSMMERQLPTWPQYFPLVGALLGVMGSIKGCHHGDGTLGEGEDGKPICRIAHSPALSGLRRPLPATATSSAWPAPPPSQPAPRRPVT